MSKKEAEDEVVLVGVLKNKRDLRILLEENWYRIPRKNLPRRKFKYLAFYQPAAFGRRGKRICYYARVLDWRMFYRQDLLPDEPLHPRARADYVRIRVGRINKLAHPIKNTTPRRVSFGFTSLPCLLRAKNILQLYDVAETEEIINKSLRKAGLRAVPQYWVKDAKRRYRLDFAVFCGRGRVAVECDNLRAHHGVRQRRGDKIKDRFLKEHGWTVLRFRENEIVSDAEGCAERVGRIIRKLGGLNCVKITP